jgi:argininosuccinate lyase
MKEDPAPEMTAMRDEFVPLKGIHAFDKAHTVMLIEQGIISREVGAKILRALGEMEGEGFESVRGRTGGGGHSGEAYLIEKLGMEIGGQLHIGRSSADLIGVAIRMEERDCILDILDGISALQQTLLQLAGVHLETILPAYTHFQQAQPITFAHYLLSWVHSCGRDSERFLELYRRINACPAGAAIVSGSTFPINRERVAELLGFGTVLQNTRDAIFGFDSHLELFSKLAILNNSLARLCSDLYIWCSSEFAMVELKDRFCGTSSVNPHKKNPQGLEQIFNLSASATGAMNTAFAVDRMPSDAWEIQWRVWSQELWPLLKKTVQGLALVNSMLSTLEIRTERMRELAKSGWICASDLAALLVTVEKVPWRTAHQMVGQLVRNYVELGKGAMGITSEALNEIARAQIGRAVSLSQEMIDRALNPLECVKARRLVGGPAPEEVKRQIKESLESSREQDTRIKVMRGALKTADHKLFEAIQSFIHQ